MVRISVLAVIAATLVSGVAEAATNNATLGLNGSASYNVGKGYKTASDGLGLADGDKVKVASGSVVITYSNGCKVKVNAGETYTIDQGGCVFQTAATQTAGITWVAAAGGGLAAGALIGYAISEGNKGTNYVYVPVSK